MLIVSDIHGRADLLREVLQKFPEVQVVCLGDAVGSGSGNDATLSLLRDAKAACLKGNHEVDLLHLYSLSDESRTQIALWPYRLIQDDVLFSHTYLGSGSSAQFWNIDSTWTAEQMFTSENFRICFVGHSHSPGWWEWKPQERPVWKHADPTRALQLHHGVRYIVDVGSLGEPQRETDPKYVVWQAETVRFEIF